MGIHPQASAMVRAPDLRRERRDGHEADAHAGGGAHPRNCSRTIREGQTTPALPARSTTWRGPRVFPPVPRPLLAAPERPERRSRVVVALPRPPWAAGAGGLRAEDEQHDQPRDERERGVGDLEGARGLRRDPEQRRPPASRARPGRRAPPRAAAPGRRARRTRAAARPSGPAPGAAARAVRRARRRRPPGSRAGPRPPADPPRGPSAGSRTRSPPRPPRPSRARRARR